MSDDDTPNDSVTEGVDPQASGGAPAPRPPKIFAS